MPGTFPTLRGLAWSTFKAPQFSTIMQKTVSGRELRINSQPVPTWLFTLKFDFLMDDTVNPDFSDVRALMGFFLLNQGSVGTFTFVDPTDSVVTNGYIAIGDGITSVFPITRGMGELYNEPVQEMTSTPVVYFDGTPFGTAGQEWNSGGVPARLSFASPPPAGVTIRADFTFAFLCRFSDDTYSFENFMHRLWSLKEIKLQSILS